MVPHFEKEESQILKEAKLVDGFYLKTIDNSKDLELSIEIRKKVFVDEQGVSPQIENDGLDDIENIYSKSAIVVIGYLNEEPIGTARMVLYQEDKKVWKVGRVSVLKKFRAMGYGKLIMNFIHRAAKENQFNQLILHAQLDVVPFYLGLSYAVDGEDFLEANIWHKKMFLKL